MNLSQKYNKKQIMIIVGVALLSLIGIGTGVWYANEQNKKQKVLDSIDIVFKENAMIEYGQEKVDFNDFIKEKKRRTQDYVTNRQNQYEKTWKEGSFIYIVEGWL